MRRDDGLCRHCLEAGRVARATVVDHIVALMNGGDDSDDNKQCLCHACHEIKSRIDKGERQVTECAQDGLPTSDDHPWRMTGITINDLILPRGLKRSAIPVTLVCGAAGSGKTTYCKMHASENDTIIDLDAIRIELGIRTVGNLGTDDLARVLVRRNQILAGLATATSGCAWLIVSAPAGQEREWWASRLGASKVVLLDTPYHVCAERINVTRKGKAKAHSLHAARVWWERYSPSRIDNRAHECTKTVQRKRRLD